MFNNINIIEILRLGITGLVFLLALLSFWLLNKEQKEKKPRQDILSSINKFMIWCFIITILVGLFSILSVVRDNIKENHEQISSLTIDSDKEIARLNKLVETLKKDISKKDQLIDNLSGRCNRDPFKPTSNSSNLQNFPFGF